MTADQNEVKREALPTITAANEVEYLVASEQRNELGKAYAEALAAQSWLTAALLLNRIMDLEAHMMEYRQVSSQALVTEYRRRAREVDK